MNSNTIDQQKSLPVCGNCYFWERFIAIDQGGDAIRDRQNQGVCLHIEVEKIFPDLLGSFTSASSNMNCPYWSPG